MLLISNICYFKQNFKSLEFVFAKANSIFCCTGSHKDYFMPVDQQNNKNDPEFQGHHI